MKNTPFKMNGFSGFGNSPLKDTDPHTGKKPNVHGPHDYTKTGFMGKRTYSEKGYTDKKNNKRNRNKGNAGYKFMKFFGLNKGRKQKQNLKFWCSGNDC